MKVGKKEVTRLTSMKKKKMMPGKREGNWEALSLKKWGNSGRYQC